MDASSTGWNTYELEQALLNLNDLYYFVRVVDHQGFAAASRALGLPKSSLNRRVIELETQLGAKLIHRTSRRFHVTEVGKEFYRHALAAVTEAETAENAILRRRSEPMGTIRFSCSCSIAQFALARILPRFAQRFPKVRMVQHATNRYVDPLEEGFDLVIRAHARQLPDSSLIQRGLLFSPRWLVASLDYLQSRGEPLNPEDLRGHRGIAFGCVADDAAWLLQPETGQAGEGREISVPFTPCMNSDELASLLEAAKSGIGITSLPAFICRDAFEAGQLRRLLPAWTCGGAQITALIPSRRHVLPSVRAFLDFLIAELPGAMLNGQTEAMCAEEAS